MTTTTAAIPDDFQDIMRRLVRGVGMTVAEFAERAAIVASEMVDDALDVIAAGDCPFCESRIEVHWDRADVHYEEDDGDPIYGPPPSYEFLIEASDWTFLECPTCELLAPLLRGLGGRNPKVNARLSSSPHYGRDAWLESVGGR